MKYLEDEIVLNPTVNGEHSVKSRCSVKGKAIAFSGIDGVGKTLYSKILAYHIMRKGLRVRTVWVKSLHTLAYILYVFLKKIGVSEQIVNPNNLVVEHFSNPVIRRLGRIWVFIEVLSITPWLVIISVYRLLGYTVVLDRYLYDFLVVVGIRIARPLWFAKSIIGRVLYSYSAKTKTIVLDAPLKTVLERRRNIEYTLSELLVQKALYRVLARMSKAPIVLTNKTVEKAVEEVLRIVGITHD